MLEKIYFPYEDTALFVFRVILRDGTAPLLELNTGRRTELVPQNLYSKNDCLYMEENGETIKFSERALMQVAPLFEEGENGFCIAVNGEKYCVPEY